MSNTIIEKIEGMMPAMREFHHLILKGKITEDEFVSDIKHRLNLFILSELESLAKEILNEADNPHNLALLGADRKQNCESAVDVDEVISAFERRGIKI